MKKLISLLLIILIFIPTVYASGNTPDTSSNILVLLMDLTNILWLPFVFIAGQLLTNDFVYGTFLGVDNVLWNIWNISKTAAMIILGVMFFRFIIMAFFSQEQGNKAIKELPKIIIAAVLINISFFLLGALIDISTILIGVAGQLPNTIVSENTNNKREVRVCNKYKIGEKAKGDTKEFLKCTNRTKSTIKEYLDGIANSSGILVFFASNVLHIDQVSNIPGGESMSLKSMTMATAIKVITSLLFIVPLIILIVINIVRIFRIWLYVAFAPLIALDIVFGSKIGNKIPNNQAFSLPNIIGMIFQPVLVVAALSLVVIFMTMLQIAFQDPDSKGLEKLQVQIDTGNKENVSIVFGKDNKNLFTMNGNLGIKDPVTSGFGQVIISLIGVLLMWGIIKASFKFSEVTKSMTKGLIEFGEQSAKAVPIIGGVGYGAIEIAANKRVFKKGFTHTAAKQAQPIIDAMNDALGISIKDIKLSRFTYYKKMIGSETAVQPLLEYLEKLVNEGIENEISLASAPNFKEAAGMILERIHKVDKRFKFFKEEDKDKPRNRDRYFQDISNPGTELIIGLYKTQNELGKVKNIGKFATFASLKPIRSRAADGNVHEVFKSNKKK